jgi:hypothetical protein
MSNSSFHCACAPGLGVDPSYVFSVRCRADILVCRFGRLSSRPPTLRRLESPLNRQARKPAPGVWTFHRMEERQSRGIVFVSLSPGSGRQSRRDCITQPRVARGALPWVGAPNCIPNPERVASPPRPVHPHRHAAIIGPNSRTWASSRRSIPHIIVCKGRQYNPFRVTGPRACTPRVALGAQPWAERYNPFGIAFGIAPSAGRISKLQRQAGKPALPRSASALNTHHPSGWLLLPSTLKGELQTGQARQHGDC